MASDGIARSKDGVPQWNGDPTLFQAYEEESLLCVETQAYHKRHMCVPEVEGRTIWDPPNGWSSDRTRDGEFTQMV